MPKPVLCLLAVLLLALSSGSASADVLMPRTNPSGEISAIGKGVKELGINGILVFGYTANGDASVFRTTTIAGGTFRYFLKDNLALSLSLDGFYTQAATDQKDLGGLGLLGLSYTARIAGGLFFRPGIAGGGFYGSRRSPVSDGIIRSDPISGGAVQVSLGFVFYAGPRFNLQAGPDLVMLFGGSHPSDGSEGSSLTTADAAFNVGLSYVF